MPSSAASPPTSPPRPSDARRCKANASTPTCSGTAARCRCCKPASIAPSSRSGSATRRSLDRALHPRRHDDQRAHLGTHRASVGRSQTLQAHRRGARLPREPRLTMPTSRARRPRSPPTHACTRVSRQPCRHSRAIGVVRLRAARRRPRQVALHADRRAHRPDRRRRHPARDRRAAHRRHQDPQGRHPRAAALRLRRPPRPAGRDRLAVEVPRRRQDRGRALRPRAGRNRRRAVRHPTGRPSQPADARHPLELTQDIAPKRCASSPARTRPRR